MYPPLYFVDALSLKRNQYDEMTQTLGRSDQLGDERYRRYLATRH